jgi:Tfp pilus assembly protein PilO
VGSRRAPIFAAVGVVLLAIALIVLLVLPKMGEVSEAQDALAVTEAEEQTLLARQQGLEAARDEAPDNEAIITEVNSQIPEVADEAGLMLLLQNAASSAGLRVSSFSISEPSFDAALGSSVMTISVSAEGTYFQVADFLYNIETLPRAAKVLNTDLSPSSSAAGTTPTLTLSAGIEAYTTDANPDLPGSQPAGTTSGEEEA